MKEFGSFRPLDPIVSVGSFNNIHLVVNTESDLAEHPDQTIAVCASPIGAFKQGTVIVKKDNNWVELFSTIQSISPVSNLRGYRKGRYAYLRWNDPSPITNRDREVVVDWVETIIVRKYGSAPQSLYDGTIIFTEKSRNQFVNPDSPAYRDYVPEADNDGVYFYRAFTRGTNGTVAMSDPIELRELKWSEISQAIKDGKARELFAAGDVFVLDRENHPEIELVVASIDTVHAPDMYRAINPHLVTFLFKYSTLEVPFDTTNRDPVSGEIVRYKITRDSYAFAKKTYYRYMGGGKYEPISSGELLPGSMISTVPYDVYEIITPATRAEYGSNYWYSSDLRTWSNLNGPVPESLRKWVDVVGDLESPLEFLRNLDSDFADIIVSSSVSTVKSRVDGTDSTISSDLFFVPSVSEIFGTSPSGALEGEQFELFKNGLAGTFEFGYICDGTRSIYQTNGWWTRSTPQTEHDDTGIELHTVDGSILKTSVANTRNSLVLAFSIG